MNEDQISGSSEAVIQRYSMLLSEATHRAVVLEAALEAMKMELQQARERIAALEGVGADDRADA